MNKFLKRLCVTLLFIVFFIYILLDVDFNNKRPVIGLFKSITHSDSALEIVDFSVDKPKSNKVRPAANPDRNP